MRLLIPVIALPAGCRPAGVLRGRQPGRVDAATDNLVAYRLVYWDSEKPVLITRPYATLLIWVGDTRRFFLYDNVRKTVYKTADFEAFLKQLSRVPQGAVIQRLDRCSASFCWEMPEVQRERLEEAYKKGGHRWAGDSTVEDLPVQMTCICETRALRLPPGEILKLD